MLQICVLSNMKYDEEELKKYIIDDEDPSFTGFELGKEDEQEEQEKEKGEEQEEEKGDEQDKEDMKKKYEKVRVEIDENVRGEIQKIQQAVES